MICAEKKNIEFRSWTQRGDLITGIRVVSDHHRHLLCALSYSLQTEREREDALASDLTVAMGKGTRPSTFALLVMCHWALLFPQHYVCSFLLFFFFLVILFRQIAINYIESWYIMGVRGYNCRERNNTTFHFIGLLYDFIDNSSIQIIVIDWWHNFFFRVCKWVMKWNESMKCK